jgi:hypothetical protein
MSTHGSRPTRTAIRILYGLYGAAAVGAAFGIWQGWFAANSRFTTVVLPYGVLGLIFVTVLVRGPGYFTASPRPLRRRGLDLLKAAACAAASFVWILWATRRVPNTQAGVVMLAAPALIGLGGVTFYLWRAVWGLADGLFRGVITPQGAPVGRETEGAATRTVARPIDIPDRVEYSLAHGALVMRLGIAVAAATAGWWVFGRNDALLTAIAVAGAAGAVFLNLRIVVGHGPGLVLDASGITIRANLSTVTAVSWGQISTISLRTTALYSMLVIGVRAPERLIAQKGAYRRWVMNQNQNMFGGPVTVFASALKCDPRDLATTANAFLSRYGMK